MEDFDDGLSEPWPKEFSELKELEKLLRCNICKDFMKTSLITGCSHLFCSYCIRQSIQYRNQCPACFAELYDNQLRPERTLDEVIRIFTSVKKKLLKRLQISYAACPGDDPIAPSDEQEHRKEHNQVPVPQSPAPVLLFNSPRKSPATPQVVKHRTVPFMFSPKPSPGSSQKPENVTTGSIKTLPCPVCNVAIPERNINLHLDECLARANGAPPKSQPMNKPSRKPLPKLVLSLMKEKELKQYCKEYGLSTVGEKKALISRIQRYTVLYNSECDSLNPRSKQEIIRQIEKEEFNVTSNTSVKTLFSQVTRKTDPKIIEEVSTKYLKDNKAAFQKLIENMKSRKDANIVRCPRPSATRIVSDDEDDSMTPGPSSCKPSSSTTTDVTVNNSIATTPTSRFNNSKNNAETPSRKKIFAPPLSPEIQVSNPSPSNLYRLPPYSSTSPNYCPTSPSYGPTSPTYRSTSPSIGPISPKYCSTSPSNCPTSPTYRSTSPSIGPTSPSIGGPISPKYCSTSPSNCPSSPTYHSTSPSIGPTSPIFRPTSTTFRSTSPSLSSHSTSPSRQPNSLPSQSNRNLFSPITSKSLSTLTPTSSHSPNLTSPPTSCAPSSLCENESSVMSNTRRSCSPQSDRAESPDLFLADMEEEMEENNEREHCASPDLMATLNSSISPKSFEKLQLTQSGNFLPSHSDSDLESKKSDVKDNHADSSNEKKQGSSYAAERLLVDGDKSDDEDFLQLVQNKRGKRKTKQLVFSPRATRSKRLKP
ncbi:hypothetical protein M8J76_011635 [Diaphorina citri]|nr:hypothetical protein M8J76_011635 [Diaphorina citri]